jgi:hypothetical protein
MNGEIPLKLQGEKKQYTLITGYKLVSNLKT